MNLGAELLGELVEVEDAQKEEDEWANHEPAAHPIERRVRRRLLLVLCACTNVNEEHSGEHSSKHSTATRVVQVNGTRTERASRVDAEVAEHDARREKNDCEHCARVAERVEQVAVQPVEQVAAVEEHLAHLLQQVALHPQRERDFAPLDLARAELHQQRVREERQKQQIGHQIVPAAALHIFTFIYGTSFGHTSSSLLGILGQ